MMIIIVVAVLVVVSTVTVVVITLVHDDSGGTGDSGNINRNFSDNKNGVFIRSENITYIHY